MTNKIDFHRVHDYVNGRGTRVRFAPSPTGWLHIGGIRTLLVNYMFAQSVGGRFYLRIEDTDRTRFVEGAVQNIIDTMEWFGIVPDNIDDIMYQSDRLYEYKTYSRALIRNENAYYDWFNKKEMVIIREGLDKKATKQQQRKYQAFVRKVANEWAGGDLTPAQVDKVFRVGLPYGRFYRAWAANDFVDLPLPPDHRSRKPTVRFAAPITGRTSWDDNGKMISIRNSQISDNILMKSDGYPTYHFANVVDDYYMDISHVIRGEEWISSTPLHINIYKAFGWQHPKFIHLPLIMNPTGSGKLSKRHSDSYVKGERVLVTGQQYIESGYTPDAIKNWLLAATGIKYKGSDFYTMEQALEVFSLRSLSHTPTKLPFGKLKATNRWHIRHMDERSYLRNALNIDPDLKAIFTANRIGPVKQAALVPFLQSRTTKTGDWHKYLGFFDGPPEPSEVALPKGIVYNVAVDICREFGAAMRGEDITPADIERIGQNYGVKPGAVLGTVRAIVGGHVSPPIDVMIKVLGKGEIYKRLKKYYNAYK